MKYIKWSLETLTNVKRITTEAMMELDLKERQIAIYPGIEEDVGASMIDADMAYTHNKFPMIGDSGTIQTVEKNEGKVSFGCEDLFGKPCTLTPRHSDIVFIIEKDDDTKGRWLNPEYTWRPD